MCSITRSPFESVSTSISSILVVVLSSSGVLFLLFVLYFSSFISICCFRLQISAFRVSFSWLSSLFSVFMVSVSSLSSLMVCLLSSSWAFMFSIVVFRSFFFFLGPVFFPVKFFELVSEVSFCGSCFSNRILQVFIFFLCFPESLSVLGAFNTFFPLFFLSPLSLPF